MDFRASLAILLFSATVAGAQAVRKEFPPIQRFNPNYPVQAERQGTPGRVVAQVHVAPTGTVTQVKIVASTDRMFAREVIRALSQWTYKPEAVGFVSEYELVFDPNSIDRTPVPPMKPPGTTPL
jgi:TonB family protein